MNIRNVEAKDYIPMSGYGMLAFVIIGILASTASFVFGIIFLVNQSGTLGGILLGLGILGWIVFTILCFGFMMVRPNEAKVLLLFGAYYGTVREAGFYYVNPFASYFSPEANEKKAEVDRKVKEGRMDSTVALNYAFPNKSISLKANACDNGLQKVNDVLGNPITIGAVVIWRVINPTQAVFAVENYKEYVSIQSDSAIRNVARLYPYDVFNDEDCDETVTEKTLRGSANEIAETMKTELQKRVDGAGLEIEEVRITHLAYAEEIAAAMLQRQQASAVIAAKQKIVDGAVGMVKMAIDKLGEDDVVVLDDERKAAMVSNLLVVLCGSRDAQPIVNSGSIY